MDKTNDKNTKKISNETMTTAALDTKEDDDNNRQRKRPKMANVPEYGSKEYWEERYRRQLAGDGKNNHKNNEDKDNDTLPYHAWYFTYDDLRPLLLPLILGGRNDAVQIIQKAVAEDYENDQDDESSTENKKEDHAKNNKEASVDEASRQSEQGVEAASETETNNEDEDDHIDEKSDIENDDEYVEVQEDEYDDEHVDDDEEEEEDEIEREGLAAQHGPISVMEIGCGDVPLGAGLALELLQLEKTTRAPASKVVQQILCTDYSPAVVRAMQTQYKKFSPGDSRPQHSADIGDIPLEFAVADARKLLAHNARSFHLILEKGTLDAMLSDKMEGIKNCVQIVSECARILKLDGYMLLVSHLNAHTDRGIGWLQDVVFEGLKSGDSDAAYNIEVHGNAEIVDELPGAGPAAYIIRKRAKAPADEQAPEREPTIPVKFYSY